MKKTLGIVIITIMLCLCITAVTADYADEVYISDSQISLYSGMTIHSSTVIGDTLYMLGDSLRSYTIGDDDIKTITTYADAGILLYGINPEETPNLLCTNGQILFGLSQETGILGPIIEGKLQRNIQLHWDSMDINGQLRYMQSAVMDWPMLYCSVQHMEYLDELEPFHMQVDAFNVQTGAHTELPLEVNSQICSYRDGLLLVFDQEIGLYVFDPTTNKMDSFLLSINGDMQDDTEQTIGYATNGLFYDAEENTIYYLEAYYGELSLEDGSTQYVDAVRVRKLQEDNIPQTVCVLPVKYASSAMLATTQEHIVCQLWDTVYVIKKSEMM